eukprot:gnl/Chilomastix_caulleri/5013.p7 GENE.gnl/Chilomastix_caulleri/5013~~gnl/Chilomastix_caulleri/5013.p7  ORF type:complete len:53 (+),score=19.72 gnl/Chilomastix_caulleri/5013:238-396(+)
MMMMVMMMKRETEDTTHPRPNQHKKASSPHITLSSQDKVLVFCQQEADSRCP